MTTFVSAMVLVGGGGATQVHAVGSTGQPPPGPSPIQQSGSQRLLIPAYFYPGLVPEAGEPATATTGDAKWHNMCNALYDGRLPDAIIVMNQDDGDFESARADYTRVFDYCINRGQTVIGYVGTRVHPDEATPLRRLKDVKHNIASHYSEFPGIKGIFVDEMGTKAGRDPMCDGCPSTTRGYYRSLYKYIKSKSAAATVVGNPGRAATSAWHLNGQHPSADILVNFEGPYSSYKTWTPPDWVRAQGWSPAKFAHLVYGAPNAAATTSACKRSDHMLAGSIFVTRPFNWRAPPNQTMLHCPTLYRLPPVIGP